MIFMVLETIAMTDAQFIPFLLVFAIIFGGLQAADPFRNRGVNLLVSLALSFFAIQNSLLLEFLNVNIGGITTFFIVMFFLAFILEVFGLRKYPGAKKTESGVVIQGALLFILLSIGFRFADRLPTLPFAGGITGSTFIFIISILFILGIFWAAFHIETAQPQQRQQ